MSRPPKQVNWQEVDEFLSTGCVGTEIASYYDMHPDTFYRKVEETFNMGFTAYSQQKKQIGDILLKKAQFQKALGLNKDADNTMLIWLGKQRLGQREPEKTLEKGDIANIVEAVYEINERNRDRTISQQGLENTQSLCNQGPDGQENTIQT